MILIYVYFPVVGVGTEISFFCLNVQNQQKEHFHLLKVFAILVFSSSMVYIHIAHKENREIICACLTLIILLCFFVPSRKYFQGIWEMKISLLLLVPCTYITIVTFLDCRTYKLLLD